MNPYELVITTTKELESILAKHFQADGIGLIQRVNDVEDKLPRDIVGKVRYLGGIRNKLAHDVDFVLAEPDRFQQVYNEVKDGLLQIVGDNSEGRGRGHSTQTSQFSLEQLVFMKSSDYKCIQICYFVFLSSLFFTYLGVVALFAATCVLYKKKQNLELLLQTHCQYLLNTAVIHFALMLSCYLLFPLIGNTILVLLMPWPIWFLIRSYKGYRKLRLCQAIA